MNKNTINFFIITMFTILYGCGSTDNNIDSKMGAVPTAPSAYLSDLKTSAGEINPVFSKDVTGYTLQLDNSIDAVDITPVAEDPLAEVDINGNIITLEEAFGLTNIRVGYPTVLIIKVTSSDNSMSRTYSLIITRNAASNADLLDIQIDCAVISPAFKQDTIIYTASVAPSVPSVNIKAVLKDPTATLHIDHSIVNSGDYSNVDLAPGLNVIDVVATAQDNTTEKVYTIVITRGYSDADLSNIAVSDNNNDVIYLSPVFDKDITTYVAQLKPTSDSINIILGTIDPYSTTSINGALTMHSGVNTVSVVVRSSDVSTERTYTIFAVK